MARGCQRILDTTPTGGGKSRMMREIIRWGRRIVLYSNRKMLTEQLSRTLEAAGIRHGIRAAGYKPALLEDIQLSSIQTEQSRVLEQKRWELHAAEVVLIDEAHSQGGDVAAYVLQEHVKQGATIIGFTATPLDLGHLYEELVVAGTISELTSYGALVPAITFAPDEPGALLKVAKPDGYREPTGLEDMSQKQIEAAAKKAPQHVIFARVFDHWKKLNPDGLPTIGFAPGVKESLWFAEQFSKRGVTAAHIDGDDVWINGQWFKADQSARDHLRTLVEAGKVRVVWNRFVLREGIDWPFLRHGIFATVFGGLSSYLQSGGRLLRSAPGKEFCIIQDHGGNWWRHGSLNSDREWSIEYTERIIGGLRSKRLREKQDAEPIQCPKCGFIRTWGPECWRCHYVCRTRSRMVLETDGTLSEVKGDIYKARRVASNTELVEAKWTSVVARAFRSKKGMTFLQAEALFAYENNWYWPPRGLPYQPAREIDWFRKVSDVYPNFGSKKGASHAPTGVH